MLAEFMSLVACKGCCSCADIAEVSFESEGTKDLKLERRQFLWFGRTQNACVRSEEYPRDILLTVFQSSKRRTVPTVLPHDTVP